MIRIAVVEDEKKFIDQTKEYFDRYQEEHHESLDITYFRDGDEIVSRYRSQFDIIFMDIQMKFMDGMTAAREIRKQDSQVIILFITNLSQYAIRGYEVGALDYILKPLLIGLGRKGQKSGQISLAVTICLLETYRI